MNVNFYKINKKVNSTLIPSGTGTQVNVVLKSPSSIDHGFQTSKLDNV